MVSSTAAPVLAGTLIVGALAALPPHVRPATPHESSSVQSPGRLQPTAIKGWNSRNLRVVPRRVIRDRIRVTSRVRAERRVVLQRKRVGSRGWSRVWVRRTGAKGRMLVRYRAPDSGHWAYRVRVPRTKQARGATGPKRRIRIEPTPLVEEPPAANPPAQQEPPQADPVPEPSTTEVAVVGDIADCRGAAARTAALIRPEQPLVVTGDLAYPDGSATAFAECYDPHYGQFKPWTFPVPGNHDYRLGASAYFAYFGQRVGTAAKPWYAVDIGPWRFFMLNSNCGAVGCAKGSAQYQWLERHLDEKASGCTAAVWHHPRWTSGFHGPTTAVADLYALLAEHGTDLLLSGHEHSYERFAGLAADGSPDIAGVRQFVVGTGGVALRDFQAAAPGSEVRISDSHGVLQLTLETDRYSWRFQAVDSGATKDSGSGRCR